MLFSGSCSWLVVMETSEQCMTRFLSAQNMVKAAVFLWQKSTHERAQSGQPFLVRLLVRTAFSFVSLRHINVSCVLPMAYNIKPVCCYWGWFTRIFRIILALLFSILYNSLTSFIVTPPNSNVIQGNYRASVAAIWLWVRALGLVPNLHQAAFLFSFFFSLFSWPFW